MFSAKVFLLIALVPIFVESYGPYGGGNGYPMNGMPQGPFMPRNNMFPQMMSPPPMMPPPIMSPMNQPRFMQGFNQPFPQFPQPPFMGPPPQMSPNDVMLKPLLLDIASTYSRLIDLTQMALNKMNYKPNDGKQEQKPKNKIAIDIQSGESLKKKNSEEKKSDNLDSKSSEEEKKLPIKIFSTSKSL